MKLNPEETMYGLVTPLPYKGPDPETMAFLQMLSEKQIELYKIPAGYLKFVKTAMCKRGDKPEVDWLGINREMHNGSY